MLKKNFLVSVIMLLAFFKSSAQVLLSGTAEGGFETAGTFAGNGWVAANHSANQWYVGAIGVHSGLRGAYISNNGGTNNSYTNTVTQVSHFYRDITFPSAGTAILTFNWKSAGESLLGMPYDYLSVSVVSTSVIPAAGTTLTGGLLGNFNLLTSWQSATLTFCGSAGSTHRLVFSWINDASGGANPAVSVDNIHIVLGASGLPVNDLPCNATFLPVNLPMSGNNTGASACSEPVAPACGNNWNNTVWYKFIAPASGCVKIKTTSGTLINTQVAAYSGACTGLNILSGSNCNDDIPPCGVSGYAYRNSLLELSGLTAGMMYHVVVDGYGFETGSFSIIIYDACTMSQMPSIPGQDCDLPLQVCSTTVSVPNPGYAGVGNRCDFNAGSNCLLQGEKGSVWYRIAINGSGNLAFDIIPNDYSSGCTGGAETDYDFALYKTGGSGATASCGSLGVPLRCNYHFLGVTGLYPNGSGNPLYGGACWDNAYEDTVGVQAGDVFLLCISNWDVTNSGFILRFPPSTPLASAVPAGGTLVWTGSTSTDWYNVENWGGCQIPDCRLNVVIPGNLPRYPNITAAGASVRSLTINPGAGFGMAAAIQLMVCNDFVNNGNLTIHPASTLLFQDTAITPPLSNLHNQKINGYLTGINALGNITVSKPAGFHVQALQDFDVKGNFLVNGGAFGGEFRAAGVYQKVSGNFTIDPTGPNIATYQAAATLEFNGSNQTYKNRGLLNNVVMNQLAGGTLTLTDHYSSSPWMQLGSTGVLSLQNGKIITGGSMVEVRNRAFNAVEPGNVNSYVEGILRKYLNQTLGTGTYEFPVGTALRGYQRMSLEITAPLPSSVEYFTASFENTVPANNTSLGSECSVTWHQPPASPLDNGYWKLHPFPNSIFTSGTFNPVLWNRNYTNAQSGFTVQYNRSGSNTAPFWQLNPPAGSITCANFPVTAVKRVGMSVNTVFANAGEVYFSTAQGLNPLPVQWVSFRGKFMGNRVRLEWETASELNNDYFEIQRALENEFFPVGRVKGAGTTSVHQSYRFDDFHFPEKNPLFYRLKQVDFDGNEQLSLPVKIFIPEDNNVAGLWPNPFSDETRIVFSRYVEEDVLIEIFDAATGIKIKEKIIDAERTDSGWLLTKKDFGDSPGVYIIKLRTGPALNVIKAILL